MSGCGAFGSFEAYQDYGVKRYQICAGTDEGTLSHAWTERYVLDCITQLCSGQKNAQLKFLNDHVAKFQAAYVDTPYNVVCLKMERVHGMELNDHLINARKGVPEVRTIRMCCEMIQTLALLHECGISHRDLKLDNIMVKGDGSLVFIDWGTARIGTVREDHGMSGTRRANGIQQLALEAFGDGDLSSKMRTRVFKRNAPGFDLQANDCVQLAHMLSALWTSCSTAGILTCGAFGPAWDEASEELSASDLLDLMFDTYDELDKSPLYEVFPEPFRSIIMQLVDIDEKKRLTAMSAWRQLWAAEKMTGPRSGKTIDLRKYIGKPPTLETMKACRKKLQNIARANQSAMDLSPQELLRRWENPAAKENASSGTRLEINLGLEQGTKRKHSAIDAESPSSSSSCSTMASLCELLPVESRRKRRC